MNPNGYDVRPARGPGGPERAGPVVARHRDIDVTIGSARDRMRESSMRARECDRHLRYGVGMRLGLTMVALLGLGGCAASELDAADGGDDFIDMDTPPTDCSAGTGAMPCPDPGETTGVPVGGACLESNDCADGNVCTAPFVGGEVGEFTCTSQCIALDDEAFWCLDSTACCDLGAVCNARGLCVEGGLDDSGTAADSGSGTAGTDGTGSEGASTGSGTTGEGGGSESGASDGSSGTTGAG